MPLFDYITYVSKRRVLCGDILSPLLCKHMGYLVVYGVVLQSLIEQGSYMDLRSCSHCMRAADEKLFCHLCTNTLHVSNERQN